MTIIKAQGLSCIALIPVYGNGKIVKVNEVFIPWQFIVNGGL
jgi:hypothetical protein